MRTTHCTHVGTVDANLVRGPHLEYPSFENRCMAIDDRGEGDAGSVMLTDQAIFCLSSGYQYCPRYRAALAAGDEWSASADIAGATEPLASDWLSANLEELDQGIAEIVEESEAERRTWGWIGAAIIFGLVFLCGGTFALFLGWQVVSGNLRANEAELANVEPAAQATLAQAPVFMVITATADASPEGTAPAGAVLIGATPTHRFPEAVTPTPALIAQTGPAVGSSTGGTGANQGTVSPPPTPVVVVPPTATPLVDLLVPVPQAPTRRPTPAFEIPTADPSTPTATASLTPTYGPPIVFFEADATVLREGECTLVRWNVKNVLEVYYEGLGVSGEGSKEECIGNDDETYSLLVAMPSGITEEYLATVEVWVPTPTVTPTKTFTPEPVFTPTWTPVPPPTTPTPVLTYGADLRVDGGSKQACSAGATCTIGLTVVNLGNQVDDLSTSTLQTGPWPSQICRSDGVCAADTITLYNVGPGNSGLVNLQLEIPADAGGEQATYSVQAASGKTGNAVRSDEILIEVQIE